MLYTLPFTQGHQMTSILSSCFINVLLFIMLFYISILYVYAAAQMRDANQNFTVCIQWQKKKKKILNGGHAM